MNKNQGVLGVFEHLDSTCEAIESLRSGGFRDLTVYSPCPRHELEHALEVKNSPVHLWTLIGGMTGTASGFAYAIWTSLDWPMIVQGKPIVSLPPFIILGFEVTVLFGALSTVTGLFIHAGLPRRKASIEYDASFGSDRFGVYVRDRDGRESEIRAILEQSHPEEVRIA